MVDVGINTFKLAWKKTPGVSGYKVSWSSFHGRKMVEICSVRVYDTNNPSECQLSHLVKIVIKLREGTNFIVTFTTFIVTFNSSSAY